MRSLGSRSLLLLAFALGCSAEAPLGEHGEALVYGEDDRRDPFATDDVRLRRLALESTLALLPAGALARRADAQIEVMGEPLGSFANLCAGEAFVEQPAAALCSGVLIDEALLLTAGHCVSVATCSDQRWVFGYAIDAPAALPIVVSDDDVYTCRAIALSARKEAPDGRRWDHALIELDRPVVAPRHPVKLAQRQVSQGDAMTVVGFPSGLPVKVAAGATVIDERSQSRDYFTLTSDTFDVSSGSGVFDANAELAGVFVRGGDDYVYDAERDCFMVRQLEVTPPHALEQASYWRAAVSHWCASSTSSVLCSPPDSAAGCALPSAKPSDAQYWPVLALLLGLARRRRERMTSSGPARQ